MKAFIFSFLSSQLVDEFCVTPKKCKNLQGEVGRRFPNGWGICGGLSGNQRIE
jgi:hypothetical protein